MKINKISPEISNFLQIVTTIAKAPKSLYYLGNIPSQRRPAIAIIGSRKPTAYGQEVAYRLAYDLAGQGVVIVSGLALSIDAIAHRAALDAKGYTVAVMAGGLDNIHPKSHRNLAIDILASGGALISEYPAGIPPYRSSFVARNRIVSGLSDGVVVVEASAKSGTIHTASFALEQGRAVMAVPGNITSQVSEGCNNLIKTGARLVTSANDVLEEIGVTPENAQQHMPLAQNAEEYVVLQLINQGVRSGEELHLQSELSPAVFSQTLSMLEITGKIRPLGGNQWALK